MGGAAVAIGSAALSQMPFENAAKFATAQITSTATIEKRPMALRRHASNPTSNSVNTIASIASAARVDRLRNIPSPAIKCVIAVATIATPGITGSNDVG